MALFINETTSSMADFWTKLAAFLTTAGAGNPNWTGEAITGATNGVNTSTGEAAFSQAAVQSNTNDIQVAFQWDTGSPRLAAVYQYNHASGAGNYNNSRAGPWDQDGDSGNGFAGTSDASIENQRYANISNTPVQYWAFCGRSPYVYAHIVVEDQADRFTHFGFGELHKFNDWTGGAYAYGQRHQGQFNNTQAMQTGSTALLDGFARDGNNPNPTNGMELFLATINTEGLPGQVANGMWSIVGGNQSDRGFDRQSNDGVSSDIERMNFVGGFRANEIARSWGWSLPSPTRGFVGAYPIVTFYWDRDSSPAQFYGPMGQMPDVRGVNINQFSAGDEILIGSDTWVIFPTRWKAALNQAGSSQYQGIMYKKN